MLVAVVQLAQDLGLVTLAALVPDSTKVRANASKRKAKSYGRMQQEEARLSAEIEALQAAAAALDTAEDAQFGMDLQGDEVPAALQTAGKSADRHPEGPGAGGPGAERVARGRAPPWFRTGRACGHTPRDARAAEQYNLTDPESSIMPASQDGFQQCYNAQVLVDADSQLIVTAAVSALASDQGQLPRLLDAVQVHYGHTPRWQMPVTAMNGTCRSWKPAAWMALWRWAGRGAPRQGRSPRARPPGACRPNWLPLGAGHLCPAQMAGGSPHRLV